MLEVKFVKKFDHLQYLRQQTVRTPLLKIRGMGTFLSKIALLGCTRRMFIELLDSCAGACCLLPWAGEGKDEGA